MTTFYVSNGFADMARTETHTGVYLGRVESTSGKAHIAVAQWLSDIQKRVAVLIALVCIILYIVISTPSYRNFTWKV